MKEQEVDFVKWFSELSNKSVEFAGGKGASLAEMYNLKIPVPPGFVVTAQSYAYYIQTTGIDKKIKLILEKLNIDNTTDLNNASKEIRALIEHQQMPHEMQSEILEAYEILGAKQSSGDALGTLEENEEPFVAIRSSATTEDLAEASFAGQQDSFLNVRGNEAVLKNVKMCMSSLFTPRAIFYRQKKGFDHSKAYLAVVVQKMVNSVKSGVMFSQNPTKDDRSIVIEAVWGLGEGIVSGQIKPDNYVVKEDLDNFEIESITVNTKKIAIIRNEEGKNETISLKDAESNRQVLDTYEIKRLAQFGRQLQEHYKKPQDIEFAIDGSGIYIVQSRPITTKFKKSEGEVAGKVLLTGLGASPGVASGPVKIVYKMEDLEKIKGGDVLVTEMTNPDMVVAMQKSAAIVTDEGGITSHAAIVSREMGIPAVVGTGEATKKLHDGQIITVDGSNGKVVEGKGETKLIIVEPIVPTKIEIKVIVDLPMAAERAARSKARSVGLTRLEGIIASSGKHPMKFVKEKKMKDYTNLLVDGISGIIKLFEEMWIRTSDLRSDEYRELEGAPQYVEGNPMLGDHGIRFSLKHMDIMKSELEAVKHAAEKNPHKKFGIMVPQVISVSEVQKTKACAREIGMPKNVVIGIMVETPAAVQIIEDLCQEGISFISFGTNDLTQYTLAIDRNNEEEQNLFDEMHPAVIRSIKQVISVCKKYKVKTSICGQAGSRPEMARILVAAGIDSISVNADAAKKISEIVSEIEKGNQHEKKYEEQNNEKFEKKEDEEKEEKNIPKKGYDLFTDKDVEQAALEALGDDYIPGFSKDGNKDLPDLRQPVPSEPEGFEE